MAPERIEWHGALNTRVGAPDPPRITLPLQASTAGGSGTFLASDENGQRWWVKPLNNRQGHRVTVTEAIVGKMGALISAPVCQTSVLYLPPEIAGWEFRPGSFIEVGNAHGSRAVDKAQEDRNVLYPDRDDNRARNAGAVALWDWCWGGDPQWLYAELEDRRLYSHDHGWYLPDEGPTWTSATLAARVDQPHPTPWPHPDLSVAELRRLADALLAVRRSHLVDILRHIPTDWPVTNEELEAVGWFLERRAEPVAARLNVLADSRTGGGAS